MADFTDNAPERHPADVGPHAPRRGSKLLASLCGVFLKCAGWRVVGDIPDVARAVVIAAPHTSNLDGLIGLSAFKYMRLDIRFMIKHSLFRGPLAPILRAMGGLPVNRKAAGGAVLGARAMFKNGPPFWLGMTPEGTRNGALKWKAGFHRIARDLDLPIIVVACCYKRKEAQVLGLFQPSDDRQGDLEQIYALFDQVVPRHPERLSAPLKRRRG